MSDAEGIKQKIDKEKEEVEEALRHSTKDGSLIITVGESGDEGHNLSSGKMKTPITTITTKSAREVYLESVSLSTLEEEGRGIVGSPGKSDRIRGVPHEYDFDLYTSLYKTESLVFRGINITANHVMQPGFTIEGGSDEYRELIKDWAEFVGLDSLFHETVKALLVWGNAYFEIIKNERSDFGEIDLKPIPPETMYVYRTETGTVIGYIQVPKTRRFTEGLKRPFRWISPKGIQDKDYVLDTEKRRGWKGEVKKAYPGAEPFYSEEVIHLKNNELPGGEYGLSVIEPMLGALTIYQGMRVDIGVITRRYAAPKILWIIGDEQTPASDELMDSFREEMEVSNIGDDIVIPAYVSFNVVGAGELTMDIAPYLSLLRDDVFAGLSVPEILMGGTIKGTLASAKIQLESFSRRIVMLQTILKNISKREIFPRVLGLKYPIKRSEWKNIPSIVFRPMETTEQRTVRVSQEYSTGLISREEARIEIERPPNVEGHMATDDQIRVAEETAKVAKKYAVIPSGTSTANPSKAGARGPPKTTGGGGDDKKVSQKPPGGVKPGQGGGIKDSDQTQATFETEETSETFDPEDESATQTG